MFTPAFGGLTIPGAGSINAVATPRTLAAAGARSLIRLVYGVDRVPAGILNVITSTTQGVVLVQCLWAYACHLIDEPRLNDLALKPGITVTHYTGGQTAPHAPLVAAFAAQGINYTDTLSGYAYSVFALPVALFDGQLSFSARAYGRRVYDPRKDSTAGGTGAHRLADSATWEHSSNPSLCLADWLASKVYGAGKAVLWSSVGPAAMVNEQAIGTPPEPRRVLGLTLGSASSIAATGDALRAYAGCWLVPTSGGMRLLPDQDGPAVATYSHSAGQITAIDPLVLRDLGNAPTAIEVVYTDTTNIPWRDATATASLPGAATTLPWRLSTVRLPGIQRYSQALREAIERLNKLTLGDMSTTLEVFDPGVAHDVGDLVDITHPIGLSAKRMRTTAVEMPGPGRWRLALTEHDPASYSDLVQTAPSVPDTNRVSPPAPPSNPAGFAGSFGPGGITWAWDEPPDLSVTETRVRVGGAIWLAGEPFWAGRGTRVPQPVVAAGTYTAHVKHATAALESSLEATAQVVVTQAQIDALKGPPGDPGLPGSNGQPGLPGTPAPPTVTASLLSTSITFLAASNGTIDAGQQFFVQIDIRVNGAQETSGWLITSTVQSGGIVRNNVNQGGLDVVRVTGMAQALDSGALSVTAVHQAGTYPTFSGLILQVTKQRRPAPALSATAAPGSVYGDGGSNTTGANVLAVTDSATASPLNGSGGPYSYAWALVSGVAAIVDSPSSATTAFRRAGVVPDPGIGQNTDVGVYKCTVTDTATGQIAIALVTVYTNYINFT